MMRVMMWAMMLALLGCAGCAENVGSARGASEESYREVQKKWTREGKTMHDLDTALEVGATYKSWDFRSAYVERSAELFRLPEARRQELLASERAAHDQAHEFYVAAASHREQWNDLGRPGSIWRVALLCDGRQEVEPLRIQRLKKITAATLEFYPYTDTFSFGYTIQFPRKLADGTDLCGPGTRRMVLRFAGPLGTLDLAWEL
jgi:hypothetical protein